MIGQTKIAHTVNANSTADGSTAIDVSQYIQDEVSQQNERARCRWDNIFTGYLLSVFVTSLQFATSHDSTWTKMIMTAAFIHFAFETSQSWHFTYSGKAAQYLSKATYIICFSEAALVWVVPDTMHALFGLEFVVSDSFSFISAICMQFNKAMPKTMRWYAFCVTLHYIGPLHALCWLYIEWFIVYGYDGRSWALIGFSALFSVYFCADVIRGKFNDIGPVIYDENKNSKFFIFFSKYGAPFISFLVLPAVIYIMGLLRTVDGSGGIGKTFASPEGIWDDVIAAGGWVLGMVGILYTIYLRATPYFEESDKTQ